MEDFLAKFYLAIVFGVLLVSALFLGYQIQLTQQLENNLDKFRTKKTSENVDIKFTTGILSIRIDKNNSIFMKGPVSNIKEIKASEKSWRRDLIECSQRR